MHPVWEKVARWIEKDMQEGIIKLKYQQSTRQAVIIVFLITLGVIALTGLLLNQFGSYCEYPDPYGR